jgi:PAS domain S-box-containing protein
MSDEATILRLPPSREQSSQPVLAEARPWSEGLLDKPSAGDHIVHFYEDEGFLLDTVAHFAAAGLAAGEPVLIVATQSHRSAFAQRLSRNGANLDAALASGQLKMLDARETLTSFMVGDEPDWDRFCAAIGPVLETCRTGRAGARVRVFGEMVDLLWRAGNRVAAVRLEELWNGLAGLHCFTLLCAYSMGNFYMPGEGELFDKVCGRHSHVIPPDNSSARVRSLETELEERRQLEGALRGVLVKRAGAVNAMEEKSAQEAERFRLLVESVEDYAIFMLDPHGRVSSWNMGAERIKGYRADEIIGQHFSRFHPPEDAGKCEMELETAAREGRFEDEGWRVRKDGTRFWANVVISRMLDRDRKLVGFAKVTRDLSHRKQLEEERVTRASLERALAEQKKIEELREQLIAIVGHDLRTPLTSVVAGAEIMLKRGMLSEADARVTALLARSADRMTKIISQLLDFTRARLAGGMSVERRPADLAEICAQVVTEVQMANPDRALIFQADDDTRGLWDRGRLAQVASNLIANAIQHGGPGSPIDVRVRDCGQAVSLAVHNQGPPVPAELLPSIFDPFRRGRGHPTSKAEGLGLGLFIVREMVRAHHGEVAARSTEAEGTTFTIRLPRAPPR